jgi:pyrroline-5-carboxylate reductase
MRLATKRLTRVVTIAAAIVPSSDSLAAAQPLFATLVEAASELTAGFSEVEEVRRKLTEAQSAESGFNPTAFTTATRF